MPILAVPKKVNKTVINELQVDLNNLPVEVDLQLPTYLDYKGFGILPNIFLLVFTWTRLKKGNLIINYNDPKDLTDFSQSYYGYVVVCTVWKDAEIVNKNGEPLKKLLKQHNREMLDKINYLEKLPNSELLIPLFDHYPKEKGLSHWFYNSGGSFAEYPAALDNSIYRIFEHIGKIYYSLIRSNLKDAIEKSQTIIWELVGNTDEHATKDFLNQVFLSPNTRGLYIKIHKSIKKNFIQESIDDAPMSSYFSSALKGSGDSCVLEISVFDSGPGLYRRFTGKDENDNVSIEEEVNIVKHCLNKGESSVKNIGFKNKGFGLDEVLQLLDSKRGFLKIRTGRVSVYRNLITNPYVAVSKAEDIELFDNNNLSSINYSQLAMTEGTQITLAFPLI